MTDMWFYDDAGDMKEYKNLSKAVRDLEREYLEIRFLLRDAEQALREDPENEYLKAKVNYLSKRLMGLEKQAPRLAADLPLEIALFTPPHG